VDGDLALGILVVVVATVIVGIPVFGDDSPDAELPGHAKGQ